jgi:hypothetical protein
MTDKKNTNDLFNIDLSTNDFLDPSEAKAFDNLFQTPAGSDLFGTPSSGNPFETTTPVEPPIVEIKADEKPKEEPPVVPIKKEAEKPAAKTTGKGKKDPALSKNIKSQVQKRENMKVDTTWNIAYAAQQYNPPENDMTLEQVREWLEMDYPELSKERCRMEIDEDKKLIVPIVKGSKNG